MEGFKNFLLGILKSFDWKKAIYSFYFTALEPELKKLVEASTNKWDDAAINAVSLLIETFLGSKEEKKD